ncbi:MAG: hypothetical protein LBM19_01875 [Holosporales bacterium]|jgi:diaminopimelate epimerase|nr:hypothetical protein [Holosporales bacterium]
MKFTKAQTNGNDFVIVNKELACGVERSYIKKLASRQFGIGCDQVIFVGKGVGNRYVAEVFNQDGSEARMCGNGACAVGKYVKEVLKDRNADKIELLISGAVYQVWSNDKEFTVSFPRPEIVGKNMVLTGNKHLVLQVENIENIENLDNLLAEHKDCNLHFAKLINEKTIRLKTFERGVGQTTACGSGAVAVTFLLNLQGKIRVVHDGGESIVEVFGDSVNLTTTPILTFEGTTYE